MKGTDHFRDLRIKEDNAQIDVCVCVRVWTGLFWIRICVSCRHERVTELVGYIKVINFIDKLSSY